MMLMMLMNILDLLLIKHPIILFCVICIFIFSLSYIVALTIEKNKPPIKYVWIIEMFDNGQWYPTIGCGLTKADAQMFIRADWKVNNPNDKFRVKRYNNGNKI
jgi:hypothetical protein